MSNSTFNHTSRDDITLGDNSDSFLSRNTLDSDYSSGMSSLSSRTRTSRTRLLTQQEIREANEAMNAFWETKHYQIFKMCYNSRPCYHNVYNKNTRLSRLMSGNDICKLFATDNQDLPVHFEQYKPSCCCIVT